MGAVFEAAWAYVQAGLSVVPVRGDGSKAPAVAWKKYQKERPTKGVLESWFADDRLGVAIVCGSVSGGLEVIDFDDAELFEPWAAEVRRRAPGLLDLLPVVRTPSGGMHVYYRTKCPSGNLKLASGEDQKTRVETRGEGGYVLAPGSPRECHPLDAVYAHVGGPGLTHIPLIDGQ